MASSAEKEPHPIIVEGLKRKPRTDEGIAAQKVLREEIGMTEDSIVGFGDKPVTDPSTEVSLEIGIRYISRVIGTEE